MSLSGKRGFKGTITAIVLLAAVVFGAAVLFSPSSNAGQEQFSGAVDHVEVCMVNDRVFGKPQIPVEFEGKTYYGCCAGCVTRIKEDRTVRYSIDPVTGGEVDKAEAVILEGPDGQALYFESAATASRYDASTGRGAQSD